MKKVKLVSGLITFFLVMPIWYYLMHWMLVKSEAGELQMFLFWVYMPFGIFAGILARIADSASNTSPESK